MHKESGFINPGVELSSGSNWEVACCKIYGLIEMTMPHSVTTYNGIFRVHSLFNENIFDNVKKVLYIIIISIDIYLMNEDQTMVVT